MFDVKILATLATALLHGETNVIEDTIVDKLRDMGHDVIMDLMSNFVTSPIFKEIPAVQEYERTRAHWLNALSTPPPLPGQRVLNLLQDMFSGVGSLDRSQRFTKWMRSGWATSREDWLDNRWRHDWRSQPRDVRGRWIPGRLDYIANYMRYRGHRIGRVKKQQRRLRTRRRKFARSQLQGFFASWGRRDGH